MQISSYPQPEGASHFPFLHLMGTVLNHVVSCQEETSKFTWNWEGKIASDALLRPWTNSAVLGKLLVKCSLERHLVLLWLNYFFENRWYLWVNVNLATFGCDFKNVWNSLLFYTLSTFDKIAIKLHVLLTMFEYISSSSFYTITAYSLS